MRKALIFWILIVCSISLSLGTKNGIRRMLKHTKLHQVQKLLNEIAKHKKVVSCLCDMMNERKSHTGKGAATYIRWGRTMCPGHGTKLMYSGYAAGNGHQFKGGASNYLCLPKNPDWAKYQDSNNGIYSSKIYGAEYEAYSHTVGEALDKTHLDYDVPCAVCQNTIRTGLYMLPGKTSCFPGWHQEYRGYLMSDRPDHSPSEYVCVDANPEHIGSKSNQDGRLFYPVEAVCGSLKCPPYVNNREITCSVCTR